MNTFFLWFGYISFTLCCIGLLTVILYIISNAFDWYELYRKFCDRNFLKNLGWTENEWESWIKKERKEMSDHEYNAWAKKHIRFYHSYINVNFFKRKVPKRLNNPL